MRKKDQNFHSYLYDPFIRLNIPLFQPNPFHTLLPQYLFFIPISISMFLEDYIPAA